VNYDLKVVKRFNWKISKRPFLSFIRYVSKGSEKKV